MRKEHLLSWLKWALVRECVVVEAALLHQPGTMLSNLRRTGESRVGPVINMELP